LVHENTGHFASAVDPSWDTSYECQTMGWLETPQYAGVLGNYCHFACWAVHWFWLPIMAFDNRQLIQLTYYRLTDNQFTTLTQPFQFEVNKNTTRNVC